MGETELLAEVITEQQMGKPEHEKEGRICLNVSKIRGGFPEDILQQGFEGWIGVYHKDEREHQNRRLSERYC